EQARARGVTGYHVLVAGAHDVDVELLGARPMHLVARAGPEVTEQWLEGAKVPMHLVTREDRIEVERDGVPVPVATRRDRPGLAGSPLTPDESETLALVAAVDVDLAVQGSSIVFGGRRYEQCTLACIHASSCSQQLARELAACARAVTICGACLDAEP